MVRVFERGTERVEIDVLDRKVIIRRTRAGTTEETSHETTSEAKAKWDGDRAAADCIARGFTRVGGHAIAPSQDELLARLAANPDDLDTYLVLSDWLSERGDPWGLVMAVQTAIAQLPRFAPEARRDELSREDARLLFQHAGRLWGVLGDTIVDASTQTYALDRLRPEWYCGFVRAITIDHHGLEHLHAFAELDTARLLQALAIAVDVWAGDALAPLFDASWPQLRELTIHSRYGEHLERTRDCAAIAPILDGTRAPQLTALAISHSRNTDALCHAIAASPLAPRLRTIALHGSQLTNVGIEALARAPLEMLDDLVITGIGPADGAARLRDRARHVRVALSLEDPEDDDR